MSDAPSVSAEEGCVIAAEEGCVLLVLRVWIPDRPGALGAVASRIGAVGGDLVGIEIIDRGAGRVVDELTVELPRRDLVDLLVGEIHDVEGADVEDVRQLPGLREDPAVGALAVASAVARAMEPRHQAEQLVKGAAVLLGTDWSMMADLASGTTLSAVGEGAPDVGWLRGFVNGVRGERGSDGEEAVTAGSLIPDVAFSVLDDGALVLAVGRQHPALRGRERRTIDALSRLVPGLSSSSSTG